MASRTDQELFFEPAMEWTAIGVDRTESGLLSATSATIREDAC